MVIWSIFQRSVVGVFWKKFHSTFFSAISSIFWGLSARSARTRAKRVNAREARQLGPLRGPPSEARLVLTDGWVMGDGWRWWVMGDGQPKSKKIPYFKNFSKTIRYFFLVVSRPLRRVFKTFSEKNSKKIKIFKFVKKFRTTFFFQRFFRFFYQKMYISQKLFDTFF